MIRMMNVAIKKRELAVKKLITPSEYYLLDEIELGTVAAANKKKQICSKAAFDLDYLAGLLNIGLNKLYVQIKSCHEKKFILREQTKYPKLEILGLNPEVFGQILIDKLHEKEIKKQIHLAVDNSQFDGDKSESQVPNQDQLSPKVGPIQLQIMTNQVPNQDQNELQQFENTNEKTSLESSRVYLESFRGENNFNFSKVREPKTLSPEDRALQVKWLNATNGKQSFEEWLRAQ